MFLIAPSSPSDQTRHAAKQHRAEILRLGWPASLEIALQALLGAIDLFFVGMLGEAATGAAGLTGTIIALLILTLGTIGAGGSVLIAQHYGAGNHDHVSRYAGVILSTGVLLSLGLALGLVSGGQGFLALIGTPEAVRAAAVDFLPIIALSFPLAMASVLSGEILRAVGLSRMPMVATFVAVGINTVLTPALMFGWLGLPELGLAGAAWATLVARGAGAALVVAFLLTRRVPLRFQLGHILRPRLSALADVLRVAWPVIIGEAVWASGAFGYTWMYTLVGAAALAASNIVNSLHHVFIMVGFGLSVAGLAVVGRHLGANRRDDALLAAGEALRLGVLFALPGAAVLILALPLLPLIYADMTEAALTFSIWGIAVGAALLPVNILNMIWGNGIFRGGGDNRTVLMTDAFCVLAIGMPLAYGLGLAAGYGFYGVLIGRVAEEVVRFAILLTRYRGAKWARVLTG